MSQSINFLKGLPKSTSRLPASLMGLIVLITLVFLVIISVVLELVNFQAYKSLRMAQKNLLYAQEDYKRLTKDYPLLVSDIPFVIRVKNLEKKLQAKKVELNSLEHLVVRRGFSEYMFDLAQTTSNTLWLNQIQINHDSNSITLNGYAIRPDSVSELMSQLLTTNSFKNVIFNLFFVKTIKNHPYLKFSIATNALGPQEEAITEQAAQDQKAQGVK
ncbi:PilN domain-containing protein [Fluoribacter gormanii]|uniref:Fimbrial assembly protein (PilN) n=1 Tax=Fluoribacter gormanii TaxID=464 RepID=A0A377GLS4_9GAMM|nr:PilN domain-containing protein [Fluoribacter gormanii]KTD05591.1 Fimbrial assembly protein (PilN) [Fluoribacter gormanii]MCW8442625.1 PilN domain-containing protein [Fluoribacter gormanii]SIQ68064.1 Fimbrial assembly protein (PilN) [Fluoribacter gormanii]STO25766.1 Fimbrial assembly protein (PilN) [Fluoribacter gormanii]